MLQKYHEENSYSFLLNKPAPLVVYIILVSGSCYLFVLKYSGYFTFIDKMVPHSVQTSAITLEN